MLQLAVSGRGAEEYTKKNPNMTFWHQTVRRPTTFALESVEMSFDRKPVLTHDTGGTFRVRVERHGDLLKSAILSFELPDIYSTSLAAFKWVDSPGLNLIEHVALLVDDQRIDIMYPELEHIYRGTLEPEKRETYDEMVGNTQDMTEPTTKTPIIRMYNNRSIYTYYPDYREISGPSIRGRRIFIPVHMFFTESHSMALPLISMQYSQLYFEVKFRPLKSIYRVFRVTEEYAEGSTPLMPRGGHFAPTSAMDRIEYFTQGRAQIDIEASMFLTYVHLGSAERSTLALTPRIDYVADVVRFERINGVEGSGTFTLRQFAYTCKALVWMFVRTDVQDTNNIGRYSAEENSTAEPMRSCALSINGVLREDVKSGYYWRNVQAYIHTKGGRLPTGVYMYSFCLDPFDSDPSGSIALSAAGNVQFRLDMNMPSDTNVKYDMLVFGITTNVFRIASGQAGLVFV